MVEPLPEADVRERRLDHAGHLAHLGPLDPGDRIEVHAQLVRVIEIVDAHGVRVQLEAGEIRHPGESGSVTRHDFLGSAPGGESERHHLDPRWARLRRPLLIEELPFDPVGVTHQHVGAVAGAAQRPLGDGEVIAHQVTLRVLGLREEHLVGIRNRDFPTRHADQLLLAGRRLRSRFRGSGHS